MGLDNTLELRIRNAEMAKRVPQFLSEYVGGGDSWSDEYAACYDMLYWRKCWNIREEIFHFIAKKTHINPDGRNTPFTMDMAHELMFNILPRCYTKKWWKEHSDSIWSYSDIKKIYPANLRVAIEFLGWIEGSGYQLGKDFELAFSDSY